MKVFKEQQRFTQTWLIVLLIVSVIPAVVIIAKEYVEGKMTVSDFLMTLLLIIFATCFIFFFKLKTRIDEKGIYFRFFPFHFKDKFYPWQDIRKAYVRTYDPISEYGGWGLKGGFFWNKKKGVAYNVSGDIGIQLELKNGKKVLIGTNRKSEAEYVLKTYQNKITNDEN